VKALHYGLLSLSVLPVGMGQSFFSLFALPSADFCDFSALALAAAATSYAFCEALSSASNDAIRALAVARAATVEEERKSDEQQKISVEKNHDWI
jgi:hypothetical protein